MSLLPTTFGVEIEFNSITSSASDLLRDLRPYYWRFKKDSSCGWEVVSPILSSENDLANVGAVMEILKAHGAQVDYRCGVHIHLGCQGFSKKDLESFVRFMIKYESVFFCLVDKIRHGNKYCKPLSDAFIDKARRMSGNIDQTWGEDEDVEFGRRLWLNGCALRRYNTMEVRLLEGTLDPKIVIGWTRLLLQVFKATAAEHKRVSWGRSKAYGLNALMSLFSSAKFTTKDLSALEAKLWAVKRFKTLHA